MSERCSDTARERRLNEACQHTPEAAHSTNQLIAAHSALSALTHSPPDAMLLPTNVGEQRIESREQSAECRVQSEGREQRAENRVKAESRVQRIESREQTADSRQQKVEN